MDLRSGNSKPPKGAAGQVAATLNTDEDFLYTRILKSNPLDIYDGLGNVPGIGSTRSRTICGIPHGALCATW